MEQMDISKDIDRKGTAARTIRKLTDLECDSQSGGEEFIGYDEASGSEDELDLDGECVDDTRKLKVRFQYSALTRCIIYHTYLTLQATNNALQKELSELKAQVAKGNLGKKNGGGGKK